MRRSVFGRSIAVVALWAVALGAQPGSVAGALSVVGVPDALTTVHDRAAVVPAPGVLGNDVKVGTTRAVLVTDVAHGTLDLHADGGYVYQPDPGYVGPDGFTYRPTGVIVTPATVTITLVNGPPIAVPDAYTGTTGTDLVVPAPGVLANDLDPDGDVLRAERTGGGGGSGSVDLRSDGGFTYHPGGWFSGTVTFNYRAWDGVVWSTPTIVTVVFSPLPLPTPTPTPPPTAPPTPTPTTPTLTAPPAPSVTPRPTAPATPAPTPTPAPARSSPPSSPPTAIDPSASRSPDPSVGAGSDASEPPGTRPPAPTTPDPDGTGGSAPSGGSGTGGGTRPGDRFALPEPAIGSGGFDPLGTGAFGGFGGVEWAVPVVALTVPGLLLMLAVLAQGLFGLLWLPIARRRLDGLGVRQPMPRRGSR